MSDIVTDRYQNAVEYFEKKDFQKAEELLSVLLKEKQEDYDVLNFLGIIKLNKKAYKEAIELFERVIELCPEHPIVYYNLGLAFQNINKPDSAQRCYLHSLKLQPEHKDSLNNLGIIYLNRKEYSIAEYYLTKVLNLEPDNEESLRNFANLKIKQNQLEEAIEILNKVSSLNGEDNTYNKSAILTNLGITKIKQGKIDEALEIWEKVLKVSPDCVITNYNLSHAKLLKGDFENGWKYYEWRKKRNEFVERKFSKPELIDQDIDGKTILVYDEQGLGDAIQFVRYLELLKEKGARIIFEYDKRLYQIFKNIKWIDVHIPRENYNGINLNFDYHISLLSLPLYFKTNIHTIPRNVPYILADELVTKQLAAVIKKNNKFNIGISWAGNPNNTNDKNRSCNLNEFSSLCFIEGTQIFSMQKGKGLEQLEESSLPVLNLERLKINSFAHNTAIIESFDLVITVDTAIAHLVGAMGKPVWVVLPFFPDWRWMLDHDNTPWYPTMKLFRQKSSGDWQSAFKEVERELETLVQARKEVQVNEQVQKQLQVGIQKPSGLESCKTMGNPRRLDQAIRNSLSDHVFNHAAMHSSKHTTIQPYNRTPFLSDDAAQNNTLYLGLSSGENFGWGVCSNYLKKELSKKIKTINLDEIRSKNIVDGKVLHALTDLEFNSLYNLKGKENIGYTFFENELNQTSSNNSKNYDLILAGSTWCREKMNKAGIKNSDVLIQGVDPELFYPQDSLRSNNLFVIFSGGKFELRKGQDIVLKAVKILQDKYDDVILINAWYNFWPATMISMNSSPFIKFEQKGNYWHEFMLNLYNINGLDPRKIFTLPVTPNEKLRDIYSKTDIGLFPNRCEGGTNLVLMEYMACGKPVIASFNTGHKDILTEKNSYPIHNMNDFKIFDNKKQLVSDWSEPGLDEIISKLEYAYHNRDETKTIGEQAGEDMKKFTWSNTADNLLKIIYA